MYTQRESDPAFAEAWTAALDQAADYMEAEAWRRAVKGTKKPVYQNGKLVGAIQEYSDTLLIFLLKGARPEKFRDRSEMRVTGLTPEKAAQLSDEELDEQLRKRGLL